MKNQKNYIQFILNWLNNTNKGSIIFLMVVILVSGICNILLPIIQRNVFNDINVQERFRCSIFILLCVGILLGVVQLIGAIIRTKINNGIQHQLQLRLMINGIENSNQIIDKRGAGAYIGAVYGDCEQIANIIAKLPLWSAFVSVIQVVITIYISISWTWILIAILLPSYLIAITLIELCNKKSKPEFASFRQLLMKINPKLLEMIENRNSILGYMGIRRAENEIEEMFCERDVHIQKYSYYNEVSSIIVSLCALIGRVIFIILLATQFMNGKINIGDVIALLGYLSIGFQPLSLVRTLLEDMNRFHILEGRIHDLLPNEGNDINIVQGTYEMKDCEIRYENENEKEKESNIFNVSNIFDNVSGVVGLSGSGKSSLIKMMTGGLTVMGGTCKFGGVNVQNIGLTSLLQVVRNYPQNPEIFDNTLEYNITFGKEGVTQEQFDILCREKEIELASEKWDWVQYREICEKLGVKYEEHQKEIIIEEFKKVKSINNFIKMLISQDVYIQEKYDAICQNLGLEKIVGRNFGVHGSNISGGEKNRIALARFLLPEGAQFFILDEPFVNIDILSLKKCMKAFKEFKPCKNGIIVSHDLNIIRYFCDDIIVVEEDGSIIKGTEKEVSSKSPLYNKLQLEYQKFHSND